MIERKQLTRFGAEKLASSGQSEISGNPDYFENQTVTSGISSAICTFGYWDTESRLWVKIAEAQESAGGE